MEDSTFEAIHVAVNIFVFIIAITATIYLFKSISELSEKAYEFGKLKIDSVVAEQVPSENAVVLDSSQVISYYFNYVKKDLYAEPDATVKQEYKITINTPSGTITRTDLTYQEALNSIGTTRKYILEYKTKNTASGIPVATINIRPA